MLNINELLQPNKKKNSEAQVNAFKEVMPS